MKFSPGQTTGAGRLRELVRPTGEEDLLHVEYPRPRLRVPVWQAALAAVILVAGVLVWMGLRAAPAEPWPADAAFPSAGPGDHSPVVDSTQPPQDIVVSVVGEVDNPGLITLAPGARVAQALELARPRPHANITDLNQAQKLADGQQIHVPAQGQPLPAGGLIAGGSGSSGGAGGAAVGEPTEAGLINLNTASVAELVELKGVGQVTAQAIVEFRESRGGFSAIEQLQEVSGIGPSKFAQISPQVTL